MRVPVSWLRELVNVEASTEEIAERLARSGTSVESIERLGGRVSDVVVAEVLEVDKVPESEKLVVAQVDAGDAGRFQVVAGARNFRAGDRVPLARPGARVTTLDQPIGVRTMAKRYESQGMLCSAFELGLGDDHTGILVLPSDTPLGADVAGLLHLDDEVLELEITPNRPDLMSMIGVAREVAVLFDARLDLPGLDVVEEGHEVASLASVEVDDPQGCPRYLARVVSDLQPGPSPALVQSRLIACGARPLGNLVDATNYVLELTGQPLHAFDLDKLAEHRIVVRRARPGERIVTLDDEERVLDPDDLVIADAVDAQAVAGVIGGAATEVGPDTRRVLIESAYFDPRTVYRTARRHDLRTGASQRFERGADPAAVPAAAALCAVLMHRWAGGRIAPGALDVGSAPEPATLRLRQRRVDLLLGLHVPPEDARRFLEGLGCDVSGRGEEIDVTVPTWRPDLEREVDLIEEIGRLYGYDRVPATVPTGQRGFLTKPQLLRRRLREVLLGAGLSEATLSSFVPDPDLEILGTGDGVVEITNPLAADQRHLRPSLVPGLLRAAQTNTARGEHSVRLFEMGTVFDGWPEEDGPLPLEHLAVGVVLAGDAAGVRWDAGRRRVDVYDIKGILELVLWELGVARWELGRCEATPYHPGRAATLLLDGMPVGSFGEIRPSVARAYDLEDGAALMEIGVAPLIERAPDALAVVDVPRLPPVLRDVALALPEDVPAGEVVDAIRSAAGEHLESVGLVDVYHGEQVGEGRRSLAFRLTFRAPDRTLTAGEADAARQAAVEAVVDRFGAEIR